MLNFRFGVEDSDVGFLGSCSKRTAALKKLRSPAVGLLTGYYGVLGERAVFLIKIPGVGNRSACCCHVRACPRKGRDPNPHPASRSPSLRIEPQYYPGDEPAVG